MSQSLEVNIKTTSDVPQAMDRAKAATDNFSRNVTSIGRKFSLAFRDIFVSFLGPLALVSMAMQSITKLIADERQKREDANRSAIDGTNKLMAAEDVYYARRVDNIKKTRLAAEQAKAQPEETTKQFLLNDPRAQEVLGKRPFAGGVNQFGGDSREFFAETYAKDPRIQDAVKRMLKGDIEKENSTGATGSALPNSTPFKGPDGFSNVVGVGANPVMEAMNAQLEEQRKQTALLEKIASPEGGVPKDFTKDSK